MTTITVSDISVDVIRKDIKNMHLAVYPPTGRVRIAAPSNTNEETIRLFLISKLGWIKRHQRGFQSHERITPREYKERESHYFQGKRYLLRINETNGAGYVDLQEKTYMDLYVKPGSQPEYIQQVINNWYRMQLKEILPDMINKWEKRLNVKSIFWGVKQMKTKWGACNTETKRIWVNLELAKKPLVCLEYIVVHELIHLIERHHNNRFFEIMYQHLPHWKKLKTELNNSPASHAKWEY